MPRTDALPTAPDAERAILGAIMLDGSCLGEVGEIIGPTHFADETYRGIYLAAQDLAEEGIGIEARYILRKLKGHPTIEIDQAGALLAELAEGAPTAAHVVTDAKELAEVYRLRELGRHAQDLVNAVCRDRRDADREKQIKYLTGRIKAHAKGEAFTDKAVVFRRLSDIEAEDIDWLWPDRVAVGKLTQIQADPGEGKTFVSLDIAARVTRGTRWPDDTGTNAPHGGVVILNAEDDASDTIKPRLCWSGADTDRVIVVDAVKIRGENERMLDLGRDLEQVEQAITAVGDCRLVIIDPVSSYCGDINTYKEAEVRSILAPLGIIARRHRVAVIYITHNRKSGGKAVHGALGSQAFTAAARMAWLIGRDPKDEHRRLMLPVKANIAPDPHGIAFKIETCDMTDGAVVHWFADRVDTSAEDLMERRTEKKGQRSRKKAKAWLADILADGPVLANDVKDQAEDDGIKIRTLNRAKRELNVVSARQGFSADGEWVWKLPDADGSEPEDQMATYEKNGNL